MHPLQVVALEQSASQHAASMHATRQQSQDTEARFQRTRSALGEKEDELSSVMGLLAQSSRELQEARDDSAAAVQDHADLQVLSLHLGSWMYVCMHDCILCSSTEDAFSQIP